MSAPAVAVSHDSKRFAAAWMDKREGKNDLNVYWAISDSLRFGKDALVHEETKGSQNHPALTFDSSGIAWVAWEDDKSGKSAIWVRSSAPGSKSQLLSDPSESAATFPTLVANAGMVGVTYEAEHEGEPCLKFRLVTGGQ